MIAEREAPVESFKYLPTTPLELAKPFGKRELFEFNNKRAVSPALAAKTTIFPFTVYSCIVPVWIYDTPVAKPVAGSVNTSRAIANGNMVKLPVAAEGLINTDDDEKSAYAEQPRLHCPQ